MTAPMQSAREPRERPMPTVSVCIPAFNAEGFTARTIQSVLDQTFTDYELVIVDDASTDGTLREIEAFQDPRIRLYVNDENLGHSGNWNRTLNLSRAPLVKFLNCDDILYPDCLEAMVDVLDRNPSVGFVFSRRDIVLTDPADPGATRLKAKHDRGDTRLGELAEVNSGRAVFARWMNGGFAGNWIGEPSNVMMRRDCLRRVGTFSFHLRQRADMDLWVRAMYFYDVGFVDRALAQYVVRSGSLTGENAASGAAWLDNLWLLDGLLSYDEIRRGCPELQAARRRTVGRVARHAARCAATGRWERLRSAQDYLRLRLRGPLDRARLYGELRDERANSSS
jgi:glycosyltransferase involved in cell wall biosynthesis